MILRKNVRKALTLEEGDLESAVALDHLLDDSLEEKGCVQKLEARVAVAAEGEEFVVEDVLYECVTCGNNRSGGNKSGLPRVRASQVARTVDGKELLASKVADDVDPSWEKLHAAREAVSLRLHKSFRPLPPHPSPGSRRSSFQLAKVPKHVSTTRGHSISPWCTMS